MSSDKKEIIIASLYSFLNKLFDIFPEILIGAAVDVVVNRNHSWLAKYFTIHNVMNQLIALGILTFLAWSLESVFQYFYSVKWRNLAQKVEHRLRLHVYEHIQDAKLEKIETTPTGQLIATINDDINQMERFLEDGTNQIIQITSSTLLIGIIFYFCSPLITAFAILPIPFILLGAFYFQHKLESKFLNVRKKASNIAAALINNIEGLLTIKSYTAEKIESKKIANSLTGKPPV